MNRITLLASAAMALSLATSPAHAQDAADQATGGVSGGLEDIVVTAQKRSERLQDVPISIAAVTASAAEAAGIRSSNDLAFAVPGLNVTRTTAATNFNLRGIGTQGGATGQDSAVALFVDGVYMPSMSGATLALNNIERVEVLKGPQGTLYGRNATGGAVNIITRDPSHDASLDAYMGYGNLETVEAALYATGGLTTGIAADIAAYYRDQGKGFGYNSTIRQDVNKVRDFAIRGKLLFELGESTRLTLAGDYSYTSGSIGIAYRGVPTSRLFDGSVGYNGGYYDSTSEFDPSIVTKIMGGSAKLEHEFGDFKLTSLTAYRHLKGYQRVEVDGTALPILDAPLYSYDGQWTEELQLNYTGEKVTAILGAFYLDSENEYRPFQIFGAAVAPARRVVINSKQGTKSYALFGQASYEFLPETNLTLGGRYTRDKRSLQGEQFLDFGGGVVLPLLTRDAKKTFSKPTWRVALDHKFGPDILGYASYSRGFKSGVYNLTNLTQDAVEPETLDAFELGVKSDLLDRRLRLNLAGFYYTYDNIQLSQVRGADTVLSNAAKAEVYGIDVEFTAVLADSLTINGGAEWLHHRYKELDNTTVTTPNPAGPGNLIAVCTPGVVNNPCDLSGNRLANVPDWTVNVSINHKMDVAGGELASNVSYAYNDGFDWAADNRVRQRAYNLVNAQMMWTAPSGEWNLRIYARNLLKTHYLLSLNENDSGDIAAPAPGRTYGFTIGVKL